MGNVAMPITDEKAQDFGRSTQTITTLEIAEMMEVEHWEVLRKLDGREDKGKHIKGYVEILNDNHLDVVDYFVKSTYMDSKGEKRPCYLVTKLGCDFLANKFRGEKGVLFTARYVKRFHDMEDAIAHKNIVDQTPFLLCLQGVKFVADDMNFSEARKIDMYERVFETYGLPTASLEVLRKAEFVFTDNKGKENNKANSSSQPDEETRKEIFEICGVKWANPNDLDVKNNSGKPSNIKPYIDFEKGWKFTEEDKEFLISYYKELAKFCIEEACGDGIEEPTEILNSLRENGVEKSKALIQENARLVAEAVDDEIYRYYDDDLKILKLIENSILDVQW